MRRLAMRWLLGASLGCVGAAGPALRTGAAAPTAAPTPAVRRAAAAKALASLARGVPRLPEASGTPRTPFTRCIAGLDFLLAAGPTATGADVERARRCRDDVLAWIDATAARVADLDARPARPGLFSSDKLIQTTWVLGAACLFLAEGKARGAFGAEAVAGVRRAAALLVDVQARDGGFGHHALAPTGASGRRPPGLAVPDVPGLAYPMTLISCTNVAALGLATARPYVTGKATAPFEAAVAAVMAHLDAARLDNGNMPYDAGQRSAGADRTGAGRVAGSIAALRMLGGSPARGLRTSEAYLDAHLADVAEGHGSPALNVFLGALAARLRGGAAVAAWEAEMLPRILARQRDDGSLACVCTQAAFGVTCDSGDPGALTTVSPTDEAQRTYVTALLLFPLLLDADDRLRVLRPGKGAAAGPERAAPATTPSEGARATEGD
ncbi:MAG: hypothetical protein U1E39_05505 [Planctomycetota bacterium]